MSIKIEVWGDFACFSRPEMKVERVSYDVITPSAARGLIEAIYWHPGMRWIIDRIHVCEPIRFTNIRRNEVLNVISKGDAKRLMETGKGEAYIATSECIAQRASMLLRDVRYVIEAHFELTEKATPTVQACVKHWPGSGPLMCSGQSKTQIQAQHLWNGKIIFCL